MIVATCRFPATNVSIECRALFVIENVVQAKLLHPFALLHFHRSQKIKRTLLVTSRYQIWLADRA
ncbi:MAG: hypothetical protein QM760_16440 [Nibricoccus sp.]